MGKSWWCLDCPYIWDGSAGDQKDAIKEGNEDKQQEIFGCSGGTQKEKVASVLQMCEIFHRNCHVNKEHDDKAVDYPEP